MLILTSRKSQSENDVTKFLKFKILNLANVTGLMHIKACFVESKLSSRLRLFCKKKAQFKNVQKIIYLNGLVKLCKQIYPWVRTKFSTMFGTNYVVI